MCRWICILSSLMSVVLFLNKASHLLKTSPRLLGRFWIATAFLRPEMLRAMQDGLRLPRFYPMPVNLVILEHNTALTFHFSGCVFWINDAPNPNHKTHQCGVRFLDNLPATQPFAFCQRSALYPSLKPRRSTLWLSGCGGAFLRVRCPMRILQPGKRNVQEWFEHAPPFMHTSNEMVR